MALMKFKRSAIPAKVPSIVDLALGELAINTYDGKLFLKKNNGTESIVEIGGGGGGGGTVTSVTGTGSVSGLTLSGTVTSSGSITLGGTLALTSGDITSGLGFTPATAAQGAKADTAVQTIASTDGSVTITGTTAIDLSVAVAGSTSNVLLPVRNTTGATLTKGTAVYISGATGQISTVSKAIATGDATSAQTLGLVTANIANNANGNVTLIGTVSNIDTSAYSDGQQLYLSPTTAGALTATKPYAPQHLVYMAVVEHAHPTQGKLFVKVQNGYEMDELHNVAAQSPANNDGLFYNTSTSLWEKKSIVTALGYTPYNASNPAGYTSNTGTVTGVTGTAPIISSGGTAPVISISAATTSAAGSMSSADKTKLDGIAANANNYVLPKATATTLGGVEVFDATVQTVAANAVTATASRTYGVQLNAADQMVVNVPWVDTNSGGTVTSVSGTGTVSGLTLTGSFTTSGSLTLGGTLTLTSGNVTTGLGYTPANKAGDTFSGVVTFSGGIAANAVFKAEGGSEGGQFFLEKGSTGTTLSGNLAVDLVGDTFRIFDAAGTNRGAFLNVVSQAAGVASRILTDTTLTSSNVTTALGFTPYNASNPAGYTNNLGTVTSVTAGTGLTGGTITSSGTIALADTAVTAGSYTNANITVDAQGRLTAASSGSGGSTAVSYPQNVQNGNYTLVLADAGKHIYSANTGPQTITIPTNASVAFPIGALVTIVNEGTTQIALSVAGVTIRNNTSSVALTAPIISPAGAVQLLKVGTNTWKATFGVITNDSFAVSYLTVAGGGGGGSVSAFATGPGGGGAGGMLTGSQTLDVGTTYTIAVGAGGVAGSSATPASGSIGGTSSFATISTTGGGGGGGGTTGAVAGGNGGSGGGGTNTGGAGGSRVAGQGNIGGTGVSGNITGAGGGGAGAAGGNTSGVNGGVGGVGLASSITGSSVFYAGGGGGSGDTGGAGGNGGGGAGVAFSGNGTAGTANRGGGGGGAGWTGNFNGGNGGSGVVIISSPRAAVATTGSPVVTTVGGNTVYQFNSSGTITF